MDKGNNENNIPSFGSSDEESMGESIKLFILETLKVVFLSLAIIIPVRFFLIQPFYVKGASMEPTYLDHEYLIIDEISYRFREPRRDEVVVFHPPNNEKQYYIKRVVGIPGDRIRVTGGQVYRYDEGSPEGKVLDESFLAPNTRTFGEVDIKLEDEEYFVMGDHREASLDSRVFGAVHRSAIVGRTWVRGWPLNRVTVFPVPVE